MPVLKITVGNSFSKIDNVPLDTFKRLREGLSYKADGAFFSGSFNARRHLLDRKGVFPTGLLHRVFDWLYNHDIDYELSDVRFKPDKPYVEGVALTLPFKPYLEQLEAVKSCVEHSRGTISMVTGSGKSVTMALLIKELKLRTLIIVPNLNLKNQLTDNFNEYFKSVPKGFITIKNVDDPSLLKDTDYDCLIIDEAHHVAAKTYRNLNKRAWKNIYYRFFFTGTPFRSKDEEQMLMESISGNILYSLDYHKAVKMGAIVPVEAYYINVPKKDTDGLRWTEVYSDLVVHNFSRNKDIATVLSNLELSGSSALCLVKEISHGRILQGLTGLEFACGKDDNSTQLLNKFNEGQTSIIGTVGVLGEGSDTRPAEWVIIAALGKSKPQFMQMIGRGLRRWNNKESCKVLIFKDTSHKWTLTHFKEQVKILKDEYGIIPVLLEIKDE